MEIRAGENGHYKLRDQIPHFLMLNEQIPKFLPTLTLTGNHNRKGLSKKSGNGISTVLSMLPTPRANMSNGYCKSRIENPELAMAESRLEDVVGTNTGYQLQPVFAEWLMGYPENWTAIDETG